MKKHLVTCLMCHGDGKSRAKRWWTRLWGCPLCNGQGRVWLIA